MGREVTVRELDSHKFGEFLKQFLQRAAEEVHDNNVAHNWHEPDEHQVAEAEGAMLEVMKDMGLEDFGVHEMAYAVCKRIGRTFGDEIALLVSEAGEALDAFRDHGPKAYTSTRTTALGEEPPKPEGVGAELADVFIRLLDTCHRYSIDLGEEYLRKMKYNKTRPARHGGRRL